MADEVLKRDQNRITVLGGISDDADQDITMLRVDPITKRLLISANFSGVAVTSLNGLTGVITLAAGTNISLGTIGNTITINASGGGTPGGSNTQLQYNNAGAFGGISGATTNGTVVTLTAPIITTSQTNSYATASTICIFDGSKNLISADTATYPSLTELSYVKGVTSAIQTQLNAKGTGTVTSIATAGLISGGTITTTGTITTSMATNKLVGRGTAGTGIMEEITLGTGLSLSGTTLNATGSGWGLTGNATTVAGTNFVGTTDNIGLMFKTNSIQSGYIDLVKTNTSLGVNSNLGITTGTNNTAFGKDALKTNSTGLYNTAVGEAALLTYAGSGNTAMGYKALTVATGIQNTAVGYQAGVLVSTGTYNTLIGTSTGQKITSGSQNTIIGNEAYFNGNGSFVTAIGHQAMLNFTGGNTSVAIGYLAMSGAGSATGTGNVAIGTYALNAVSTGSANVALGYSALLLCSSGSTNFGMGTSTLSSVTTFGNNVAIGDNAAATYNSNAITAIGARSLNAATGVENVGIGHQTMYVMTTGQSNTAIGYLAARNIQSSYNVSIGAHALELVNTGGTNVAIGYYAANAFLGANITAVGYQALKVATGVGNTALGNNAGQALTSGTYNTLIGTGNTGITTGSYNTVIGSQITGLAAGTASNIILADGAGNIKAQHDSTNWTLTGTTTYVTGTLDIGNATDTTLARVSAGVVSIEGNNIVTNTSSPTLNTITTTGNIELGHASDTTIARVSAGVVSIEGVNIVTTSSTDTLTNKTLTTPKLTGYTVATLPAGVLGMTARVTDALAPAMGVAVAGGGAANAMVWYNGAAWSVTGI